jgi:hypothetical protein
MTKTEHVGDLITKWRKIRIPLTRLTATFLSLSHVSTLIFKVVYRAVFNAQ